MAETGEIIKVVVAMDFSEAIMEQLRQVSPRLDIEQHFPDVPDTVWEEVEILYTLRMLPEPAQVPRLRWMFTNSRATTSTTGRFG